MAGATGFIGRAVCQSLAGRYRTIGLTRRPTHPPDLPGVEWRACDLFSSLECEYALKGVDAAFYLVHSMIPSARLTQGSFQDMDLIIADNFARAAEKQGLRQILYLGGLIPCLASVHLSRHLESRLEVERTLGSRKVPLTALRASIVLGANGSSFSVFRTLLERLRWIPCPSWSRSLTQPVALQDVLDLFQYCLEHPEETKGTFDVGSQDIVSYRQLLEKTATLMGRTRTFFNVPIQGSLACKTWLHFVTGVPFELISPLVESMRFPMVVGDRRIHEIANNPTTPLDEAISRALLEEKAEGDRKPPVAHLPEPSHYDVRSVQRLPLAPGQSARGVAEAFVHWLSRLFRYIVHSEVDASNNVRFVLSFAPFSRKRWCLLELTYGHDRSQLDDRQVFYITGGALARKVDVPIHRPRLEFREVLNHTAILVAIHDYRPTLPAWLYAKTQALVHLTIIRRFAHYLRNRT